MHRRPRPFPSPDRARGKPIHLILLPRSLARSLVQFVRSFGALQKPVAFFSAAFICGFRPNLSRSPPPPSCRVNTAEGGRQPIWRTEPFPLFPSSGQTSLLAPSIALLACPECNRWRQEACLARALHRRSASRRPLHSGSFICADRDRPSKHVFCCRPSVQHK